jgi:predicted dithiol-disulfide oxidoreductase (DUF899 family)
MTDMRFPGESAAYRKARKKLLAAEIDLRKRVEAVAALRRKLPLGGEVAKDYVFDEGAKDPSDTDTSRSVKLSQLFAPGKDTLILYSYMYGPKMKAPCPMCTSMLDGLEGQTSHVTQRANIAVVARSPLPRVRKFAKARGWKNLRLLSSAKNSYHRDYHGEDESGDQNPMMNVFVRRKGKIHHFWASELLFSPTDKGADARHVDQFWPLWHLLDLTPEGRGADFYPSLKYGKGKS